MKELAFCFLDHMIWTAGMILKAPWYLIYIMINDRIITTLRAIHEKCSLRAICRSTSSNMSFRILKRWSLARSFGTCCPAACQNKEDMGERWPRGGNWIPGMLQATVHPGRLRAGNLQITHFERKMIFQTSMSMFHVNLQGCNHHGHYF